MHESRKSITVLVSILLLGLTVGLAHADDGSTQGLNLDPRDQPVTETLVADIGSNSTVAADTESLASASEPDCPSNTLTNALGVESALTATTAPSSWTCGPCSISACRNLPVGTSCGFNKWCVVTISCSTQPLTERCVCGTDHF